MTSVLIDLTASQPGPRPAHNIVYKPSSQSEVLIGRNIGDKGGECGDKTCYKDEGGYL